MRSFLISVGGIGLLLMNMMSLFMKNHMNERMSLLIVNMVLHFQTINQMSWITPHNGEQTPKMCE